MVAIVLYNPDTPGLQDRDKVETIRAEFFTILR